jgi:DNA-binding CsgD family transcriptional regulator
MRYFLTSTKPEAPVKPLSLHDLEINNLPPREGQALAHAALGYTVKETARAMSISARTVETYIGQSMLRLNARNRVHLITQAFNAGIVRVRDTAAAVALCFVMAIAGNPDTGKDPSHFMRMQSRVLRVRTNSTKGTKRNPFGPLLIG